MDHAAGDTALITGASRGIGLGIAQRLASRGFGLTISARDPDRLAEAATTLRASGASDAVVVAADMADPDVSAHLVETHRVRYGSLGVLVLNAGVGTAGGIADLPLRRFDKTLEVNLRAPFALLQHALPLLRATAQQRPGRGAKVIAMSSITGVYAEAGLAAYGATKAAVLSLVETLNAEESGNGVTATALAPAYVDTDMSAWVSDQIPAASMIQVDDVVELVDALLRLSASAVVNKVTISRAGTSGYSA
jgi:3-oxoacyl-[acyl-carrier protein] reductase